MGFLIKILLVWSFFSVFPLFLLVKLSYCSIEWLNLIKGVRFVDDYGVGKHWKTKLLFGNYYKSRVFSLCKNTHDEHAQLKSGWNTLPICYWKKDGLILYSVQLTSVNSGMCWTFVYLSYSLLNCWFLLLCQLLYKWEASFLFF